MLSFLKRIAGELIVLGIVTQVVYWILLVLSKVSFNTKMIIIGTTLIIISSLILRAKDYRRSK